MVAMNPQTWDEDVAEIEPGGYLFYDSPSRCRRRSSATTSPSIGVPLTEICNAAYTDPRQRQLFKNIIYLGALAALLDIDAGRDREADRRAVQGQGKAARAQSARRCTRARLRAAAPDARSACASQRSRRGRRADLHRRQQRRRRWAAVYGGATVCTPGTRSRLRRRSPRRSASDCRKLRADPAAGAGNRFAIVQAEDELASIGIVIGATWNGARAFTTTSGPGISLMQEFLGAASRRDSWRCGSGPAGVCGRSHPRVRDTCPPRERSSPRGEPPCHGQRDRERGSESILVRSSARPS